jgi:hypothetical protein
MILKFRVNNFTLLKASLPPGYIAVRAKSAGRKDAVRYEIYHGGAHTMDNWIGDIVYWQDTAIWDSQPKTNEPQPFKFPANAVDHICGAHLIAESKLTPPF